MAEAVSVFFVAVMVVIGEFDRSVRAVVMMLVDRDRGVEMEERVTVPCSRRSRQQRGDYSDR